VVVTATERDFHSSKVGTAGTCSCHAQLSLTYVVCFGHGAGVLRDLWLTKLSSGVVKYSPWGVQTRKVYDEVGRFLLRYSPLRATRPSSLESEGQGQGQGAAKLVPVVMPFDASGITFHRFTHGELLFVFGSPPTDGGAFGREEVDRVVSPPHVACLRHRRHHGKAWTEGGGEEPRGRLREGDTGRDDLIWLQPGSLPPRRALHAVFANQYPIGPYSGLLTPWVDRDLPQVLTIPALEVLLSFVAEFSMKGWRFGFNSLGAGASVNHLHFQFFHLDPHSQGSLPVERVSQRAIKRQTGGRNPREGTELWVLGFPDWPLRALVYRRLNPGSAELIGRCAGYLQEMGLPHTLLVAGDRAYLFPRKPLGVSPHSPHFGGGKPGLLECSGEYIMASKEKFGTAEGKQVCPYPHLNPALALP